MVQSKDLLLNKKIEDLATFGNYSRSTLNQNPCLNKSSTKGNDYPNDKVIHDGNFLRKEIHAQVERSKHQDIDISTGRFPMQIWI